MNEQNLRVFFALWPPTTVAEPLCQVAGTNAQRFGGKPTRQESIHMTLAFLGDVAKERLDDLIQAARSVRARNVTLCIDKLGYWRHNHLLWAGCSSPPPELLELVRTLRTAVTDAGFSLDRNANDFTPHITLVRNLAARSHENSEETLPPSAPAAIPPLDWHCASYQLVYSQLSDGPPRYLALANFPLHSG